MGKYKDIFIMAVLAILAVAATVFFITFKYLDCRDFGHAVSYCIRNIF